MMKLFRILLVTITIVLCFRSSAQDIPKWKIGELEAYIKQADKPVIINFWATFCKPCVEEIPYFQKLAKKYESSGLKLLLVSLDAEDAYQKISPFAKKYKFSAPIVFLDETNADLFCPRIDESWSGAIPASLFVNNKTGYRKFFEEQIPKARLEKEIRTLVAE